MDSEPAFYDKNGNEIREFDLIKLFHFKGVNDRGNGRKNYFMYKWVQLSEFHGTKRWIGLHLDAENGSYFLSFDADENRVLKDAEIVQSSHLDRYISK